MSYTEDSPKWAVRVFLVLLLLGFALWFGHFVLGPPALDEMRHHRHGIVGPG